MRKARVIHLLACLSLAAAVGCGKKKSDEDVPEAPAEPATPVEPEPDLAEKAQELAKELIIVDGHIDLPYRLQGGKNEKGEITEDVSKRTEKGDFDYPRAIAGGLDAPFMSIYVPARYQKDGGGKALADELIDMVEGLTKAHPDKFALATSPDQIVDNSEKGLISLPLGIENGTAIEKDLANLQHFYDRGVRYITLTHGEDNAISDSSYADTKKHKGLSDFGKKVVAEMNRLGIMVDISHVSDEAFMQTLEVSATPVIASHSSLRHFVPGFERNVSDEMLEALAKNGGVIMINFGSTFVDAESNKVGAALRDKREAWVKEQGLDPMKPEDKKKIEEFTKTLGPMKLADVSKVADHIMRVVELVGIDHVGLGSDFDGVGPTLPVGLEDVSKYPALFEELLKRGMSEADLAKLASGNIFRVWNAVIDYAGEAAEPE